MTPSLQELLAAPLDPERCEATSFPWWFVFDPHTIHARALSTRDAISGACLSISGPFFSRETATAWKESQRHNLSSHAVVWCGSGHMSRDYRALLEMAQAPMPVLVNFEDLKGLTGDDLRKAINRHFASGISLTVNHGLAKGCTRSHPHEPGDYCGGSWADAFLIAFGGIQRQVHENAKAKGWHKEERNEGELIALEHAELSECLEALRHGNPPSEHIPEFTGAEEELADVIIRIMDHAAAKGHRVAEAIIAKIAFNATREHRHGGKRF